MILSNPCDQILKAFAECRRLVVNPKKTKVNPHLKNHYADLEAVSAAIDPALTETGLILVQAPLYKEGQAANVLIIETVLIHAESGQTMTFESQIPIAKSDSQGFGSANTYIRRYAKMSIFDLNATDDDGSKAVKNASDWKREMMQAKDIGELDGMIREISERFSGDNASLQILRDAYAKRKTELKNEGTIPFNPGDRGNARRGGKIEVAPKESHPEPPATPLADDAADNVPETF